MGWNYSRHLLPNYCWLESRYQAPDGWENAFFSHGNFLLLVAVSLASFSLGLSSEFLWLSTAHKKPFCYIEFRSINLSSTLLYRTENFRSTQAKIQFDDDESLSVVKGAKVQFNLCAKFDKFISHFSVSAFLLCFHVSFITLCSSENSHLYPHHPIPDFLELTARHTENVLLKWNIDFRRYSRNVEWMRQNYEKNSKSETRRK